MKNSSDPHKQNHESVIIELEVVVRGVRSGTRDIGGGQRRGGGRRGGRRRGHVCVSPDDSILTRLE